jgi:hypothetical protein
MRGTTLCAFLVLSVGCTRQNVGAGAPSPGGGGDGSGATGVPPPDNSGNGNTGGGGSAGGSGGGGGNPGGGGTPQPACYSEPLSLSASLDDLAQAFMPDWSGNWLQTALSALERRTPGGYALLDAQKGDPNLPQWVDPSAFTSVMASIEGMCGSESHAWDWAHASNTQFGYWMPPSMTITPDRITTFPRSEIIPLLEDDSTSSFDNEYLYDQTNGQGGMVTLAQDLNSHTNGLACITAVGDHVKTATPSRDGLAAQAYYLELYLHQARTAHASVYATLQASANWQKLVRYEWARANFWYDAALMFPSVGVNDAKIWAHVHEPNNLAEIAMFTGLDPSYVACNPN